jgi:hypothetical protein
MLPFWDIVGRQVAILDWRSSVTQQLCYCFSIWSQI